MALGISKKPSLESVEGRRVLGFWLRRQNGEDLDFVGSICCCVLLASRLSARDRLV